MDVIANQNYIKTNEIFQAVTKRGKDEGRGEIENKPAITDADMSKLSTYFIHNMQGPPNGNLLQEIVLFNVIYYCGRRGRENLRKMTKDTFKIETDHDGRKYLRQIIKECDKNHKEDDYSESNAARIYEMPGNYKFSIQKYEYYMPIKHKQIHNKEHLTQKLLFLFQGSDICPVKIYKLYLEKLNPNVNFLWQRPKNKIKDVHKEWFDAAPVGRDPLNTAMKNISKNAELSQCYTNHCLRATVVVKLNEKGFEARHIMATTGHKSEASIRSYATKCPPNKRRDMSEALAEPLMNSKKPKTVPTATLSSPKEAEITPNIQDTDINFQLFPEFEDDDDIPNDQLLQVLTQIEEENKEIQLFSKIPHQRINK